MAKIASKGTTLWELLAEVPDHREPSGRRYTLLSVLAIAFAAVMSGRTGLAAIARWGRRLKRRALDNICIYREKAPCHATYHNVFKGLSIEALERALALWVSALAGKEGLSHIAIDGKTLRGSRKGEYPAVHLLSAYCEAAKGVVSQLKMKEGENEITAALRLLKETPLKGVVVTGDAIFTQKKICKAVTDGGGDYFFTVKSNQPQLLEDIKTVFEPAFSPICGASAKA